MLHSSVPDRGGAVPAIIDERTTVDQVKQQRRGRAIAMSPAEVDDFLRGEHTCRVATVGGDGQPHVAPLWFVWDGSALWLNSIVRSQRWADLDRDPRIAVVVDAGTEFWELRGVELAGRVEVVGDVPRTTGADPELTEPERLFARKYRGAEEFTPDGRHAWLRVRAEKIASWDFRKNPALRGA
jgi:PPOX class probable F420-dependent enzyme